jgi:RimJ/RimL family protein N-acetyltransferase
VERQWGGPAYRFPEALPQAPQAIRFSETDGALLERDFPEWVGDVPYRQPFLALWVDGRVVSVCCSVRIGPRLHEAGVETRQAARGKGFAPLVVAAWAGAVRQVGACPVYSTRWDNIASQSVATRLGLIPFGIDFDIT